MRRSAVLVLGLSWGQLVAHEWSEPHHDEELSIHQARSLGFDIRLEPVSWHNPVSGLGRTDATSQAVAITVDFPMEITGYRFEAGDLDAECDSLFRRIDGPVEGDVPGRYLIDTVLPIECGDRWSLVGIYVSPGQPESAGTYLFLWIRGPE